MAEGKKPAKETAAIVQFPMDAVEPEAPPPAPKERYQGASLLKLTREEEAALAEPFADDDHDILPSGGEVYVSQVHVRRRLNRALGYGQWALIPSGPYTKETIDKRHVLYREYDLYVRGCFVGGTVGESEYYEDNDRSSWATAAEVLKSNALTRACKDLGIASECWDRHWTEAWKKKFAVRVFVKKPRDDKARVQWRRKDADPVLYETGIVHTKNDVPDSTKPAASSGQAKPPTTPAADGPETKENITLDQVTVLIDTATERGISKAVLEKIVASEAGVTNFERIPTSKYEQILKALRGIQGGVRK